MSSTEARLNRLAVAVRNDHRVQECQTIKYRRGDRLESRPRTRDQEFRKAWAEYVRSMSDE